MKTSELLMKATLMQVTRYSADIWDAEAQRTVRQHWIVVGDEDTSVEDARSEALGELAEGEDLRYDGRDNDCGGPVFLVVRGDHGGRRAGAGRKGVL